MSGCELTNMGQAGELARYPVHWHIAGESCGSYLHRVSIHDCYQRWVTVHWSHNVLLSEVRADLC